MGNRCDRTQSFGEPLKEVNECPVQTQMTPESRGLLCYPDTERLGLFGLVPKTP
jgi:hypothetical protein